MEKPYAEQLSDWLKRNHPARRDQYQVAFLAVSDDVRAALAAGFAMNTIWRHLHASGRIPFGYDTFLKHVHRMQKSSSPAQELPELHRPASRTASAAVQRPDTIAPRPAPAPAGFHFNPIPNKKELL
ncbi:TraK family protein [Janthinobacterium sp. HLX7-2]|uniref:TraK family protein n=1 Tax=Janthinobacterium sp. HLX7-2 TaxID=1259331 RepID=UPI003F222366